MSLSGEFLSRPFPFDKTDGLLVGILRSDVEETYPTAWTFHGFEGEFEGGGERGGEGRNFESPELTSRSFSFARLDVYRT